MIATNPGARAESADRITEARHRADARAREESAARDAREARDTDVQFLKAAQDEALAEHVTVARDTANATARDLVDDVNTGLKTLNDRLAAAGKGVLQLVSDFHPDGAAELAMVRRIVERSGRPLSFSLVQSPKSPDGWKAMLAGLSAAVDAGLPMKAQVCGRPVGVLFGLELTLNPFSQNPVFAELKDRPLADKVAALREFKISARAGAFAPSIAGSTSAPTVRSAPITSSGARL